MLLIVQKRISFSLFLLIKHEQALKMKGIGKSVRIGRKIEGLIEDDDKKGRALLHSEIFHVRMSFLLCSVQL